MQKKSIPLGLLALALFSTVVYAFYGSDEVVNDPNNGVNPETPINGVEPEAPINGVEPETPVNGINPQLPISSLLSETPISEVFQKTWTHVMTVHIQNNDVVSPDDEIKVQTSAKKVSNGKRKGFWMVTDTIRFSFNLPNHARLKLEFKSTSNETFQSNAWIQMNDDFLRDKDQERATYTFRDMETTTIENVEAKAGENTLTLIGTKGSIGLELLTITAEIDYPNWTFSGMKIWLTSPNPGKPLDGSPVPIHWQVTSGRADNGWVKVLYRIPGQDWEVVPGLEGISYGSKDWGYFIWEKPPQAKTCEFDFVFEYGENPIEKQKVADAKKSIAISAATKKLIQAKKNFLDESYQLIPSSYWKKHLKDIKKPCSDLANRLEAILGSEDENIDGEKVVQIITDLEGYYFLAFQKIMKTIPTLEDSKEREDLQLSVEQFMDKLTKEFSIANIRYGEQEDTKELIPKMFPKDRFETFLKAKNELDKVLEGAEEATPNTSEKRKVLTADGIEYVFRWCPPGKFLMSSPEDEQERYDDEKQHEVKLTKGFWILETEVTQQMWQSVMGTNPSKFKGKHRPVESVSWNDCQEFCRKLSKVLKQPIQLPTEAQWEYACRAGTTTPFSFGDTLNGDNANCDGKYPYGTDTKGPSPETTVEVSSYSPNEWGLYDMHGNVREWCSDWYDEEYYSNSPKKDPENKTASSFRVNRGGSWDCSAGFCRSANRSRLAPEEKDSDLGFRICFVPGQEE
ncbi:MAG: formylglycine-generating enzyme family protein [Thermoguttaceae bacterium]|nr:formylglycine-generating enzyme family protein [Thermoguttaceae bacterium]